MALKAGEYRSGGEVFDSQGRRCIVVDANPDGVGEYNSGGRYVDLDGRILIPNTTGKVSVLSGAAPLAGEYRSGGRSWQGSSEVVAT